MSHTPHSTPAPPAPDQSHWHAIDLGLGLSDVARLGMDSVADLGRLFHIIARLTEPGSAAYHIAQSGITLADDRRSAIDVARACVEQSLGKHG
ncbi:hypothetical protein [Andreprevotia chitinilytica]|uniref:hypothetical protein n=1 Tax=Andreprevotia chitinilytica TaxID=396808 RepID=UPI0005565950|nr:hypothetical protein [Andreprevotia chitinilytica]